jgi:O-antigen/teichoic acid export membrane protein
MAPEPSTRWAREGKLMKRQVPRSVTTSIWLLRAVVAWSGLTALLTYVFRDDLVLSWAEGNKAAQTILDEGGMEALQESSINIPAFAPLAIVLFVVFAALAGVLVVFFRGGHAWARTAITAMVLFLAFSTAVGLDRDLPVLFAVLSVVALLLNAALLLFLWHKDTTAYLKVD